MRRLSRHLELELRHELVGEEVEHRHLHLAVFQRRRRLDFLEEALHVVHHLDVGLGDVHEWRFLVGRGLAEGFLEVGYRAELALEHGFVDLADPTSDVVEAPGGAVHDLGEDFLQLLLDLAGEPCGVLDRFESRLPVALDSDDVPLHEAD